MIQMEPEFFGSKRSRRPNRGVGNQRAWAREMKKKPCHYCGKAGGTVDHVVPLRFGGQNASSNCVPACVECNQKRNTLGGLLGWEIGRLLLEALGARLGTESTALPLCRDSERLHLRVGDVGPLDL